MENKLDFHKISMEVKQFSDKLTLIEKKININSLQKEVDSIQEQMKDEAFWTNSLKASHLSSEYKLKKEKIKKFKEVKNKIGDLTFLINEMPEEEKEILAIYESLNLKIKGLEIDSLLNGKYDNCSVYLEIHPGAGGVESHDFAQMLKEMYEKYFNKSNMKYETIDLHKGEVAGIKSVTLEVSGERIYGFLKSETGIHRLIRLSPFDSGNRRHTSFASVKVTPIIENEEIEINDTDLKIETFRSSGAGGQSVNTTDSAVRITHVPSGIVVSCQNERSQIQNKEHALKILKSKLIILEREKQIEHSKELVGDLKNNSFGSQKRTYTLHPYKLVKDHISGHESSQAEKVLMGSIEEFIYANLLK